MTEVFDSVGVLGAGAWGTALAQTAAKAGRRVVLWSRRKEHAVGLGARRENADYLPGVELDANLRPSADLAEAMACGAILSVVPAQHTRAILIRAAEHARPGQPIVCCSKGLEQDSRKFMAAVVAETLPQARIAVLSGPGFAAEVANDLPAAVTLASADLALAQRLAATIARPTFRPYVSDDVIGAEVGGVVKNVLAIGCGIVEGRRLGRSAHASLVTRGFAEMIRLGAALGAKAETLQGPCGLGDLVLTCSSTQSRNMSLGVRLGQGQRLKDILDDRKGVTEGVATAPALVGLARDKGVEMPICEAVLDILTGRSSVDRAIARLLSRPLREQAE